LADLAAAAARLDPAHPALILLGAALGQAQDHTAAAPTPLAAAA